jgi:hypothetical protein
MNFKPTTSVIVSFAFILLLVCCLNQQSRACQTPDPGTPTFHWAQNSFVYYTFDVSITDAGEKDQIRNALALWTVANLTVNCSNVVFREGPGGNLDYTLTFYNAVTSNPTAVADFTPLNYSTPQNLVFDGRIRFNTGLVVNDPNGNPVQIFDPTKAGYDTFFTKLALHEIGHSLGLTHYTSTHPGACMNQEHGASVMNDACNANDMGNNQATSPTTCDNTRFTYYACPTPTPSPTPAPQIGYCQGAPYPDGTCAAGFVNTGGVCDRSYTFQSRCADPSGYDPSSCSCPDGTVGGSPIIIDVDNSGISLTNAENGVDFDLYSVGARQRLSWTTATATNAFLALDRNGNGTIDNGGELFGDYSPQMLSLHPNGFLALAEFDKPDNGGNGDENITSADAIFSSLRLWRDANHNGMSEANELFALPELGIQQIDLLYRASRHRDDFGNVFRYRAKVYGADGQQLGRWAYDVFLQGH